MFCKIGGFYKIWISWLSKGVLIFGEEFTRLYIGSQYLALYLINISKL